MLDPGWYEDRDADLSGLFSRAEIAVALRAGDGERLEEALEAEPRWAGRVRVLDQAPGLASISSRAVRRAARRGRDVSAAVPPEIAPFVRPAARG